jgi:uncharacterized membrane protein
MEPSSNRHVSAVAALVALLVVYAFSRVLQIFTGQIPMLAIVMLHVIPAAAFAWIHGALLHRFRGILVFFVICIFVGNVAENIGVRTGLPFGHYFFTDVMGPKLLVVPILLGGAYIGMGYVSWTLSRLILGQAESPISASSVFTVPLIASFLMVAWDLAMDSIWSTVLHAWIWQQGGAYFGVPLSNFLGWFLTNFAIFLAFALCLKRRPLQAATLPPAYWHLAIAFYAVSAAGNLVLLIPPPIQRSLPILPARNGASRTSPAQLP